MMSLRRLKSRGLRLSIDDFGTGYSSLSYLKRFHVDSLKIDQSFVRDILQDEDDRAIVQAVVQMARSLNLRTVAEGVEDDEQARMLRDLGCEDGQGYVFARPLPARDFENWLRTQGAIR
jgi:EAL domain-containing protein (putative c-di-GMP-specific phosphodiesterase class I)